MIALVLGGARSGKSAHAERLAASLPGPVSYLATATVADAEMAARVAVHRRRRPPSWRVIECGTALDATLEACDATALVDSLGTWVAGHPDLAIDLEALIEALISRRGDTVVVSEEVGSGIHPGSAVGRRFRDVLGELNQAVAAVADEVVLVVAGRPLVLGPGR